MEINLMDYIVEQALILVPVLYILGVMLKNTDKIKDWTIPWILLSCGVACCIAIMGVNIQAILQGILVTGVTVFGNQLVKQSTEKREEEK
ncbi:phage holin family protein [Clostridium tetani]|uniref:phage holin family protein n=1 Tax=Clostridium tetani TaxID=1513 RepID=UPI0039C863D3